MYEHYERIAPEIKVRISELPLVEDIRFLRFEMLCFKSSKVLNVPHLVNFI